MPICQVQEPCSIMNRAQKIPPDFKDAVLKMLTVLHLYHYCQDPQLPQAFHMFLFSKRHYAKCCGSSVELTDPKLKEFTDQEGSKCTQYL